MNLPPEKAVQLEQLFKRHEESRGLARALGLEHSFCELVYKDITGFGNTKDTFRDNEKPAVDPTAGLLAR